MRWKPRSNAPPPILRARKIDGAEALRIGLVHSLHPVASLKAAAIALAEELAAFPSPSVAGVLRCVVEAGELPLADALRVEREAVQACRACGNQDEGLAAFAAKRAPRFPVP